MSNNNNNNNSQLIISSSLPSPYDTAQQQQPHVYESNYNNNEEEDHQGPLNSYSSTTTNDSTSNDEDDNHNHHNLHHHHYQRGNSHKLSITHYFKKAYQFIIDIYFFVPLAAFPFQMALLIYSVVLSTRFDSKVFQNTEQCPSHTIQILMILVITVITLHLVSGALDLVFRCVHFCSSLKTIRRSVGKEESMFMRKMLNSFICLRLFQYILETVLELFVAVYFAYIVWHSQCQLLHEQGFFRMLSMYMWFAGVAVLVNLFLFQYCVFPMAIVLLSYLYEWFYVQRYGRPTRVVHTSEDDEWVSETHMLIHPGDDIDSKIAPLNDNDYLNQGKTTLE